MPASPLQGYDPLTSDVPFQVQEVLPPLFTYCLFTVGWSHVVRYDTEPRVTISPSVLVPYQCFLHSDSFCHHQKQVEFISK